MKHLQNTSLSFQFCQESNISGIKAKIIHLNLLKKSINFELTIIQIGEGASYTVPVYEGYSLPHAMLRFNVAGRSLTDFLVKLLEESGSDCSSPVGRDTANDIKETLCYVSQNYEEELATSEQNTELAKSYQLPDGKIIDIREPRLKCPEALFKPELLESDSVGIHEMLNSSIIKCDVDLPRLSVLYQNIVLSGGSTLFTGLEDRLAGELRALAPPREEVRVVVPETGSKFAVWVGGSVLSSLSTFKEMWVTRLEYLEQGPEVVHCKCF